jgi:L-seryl-tRNA(Ser) seleniumtransferase
MAVNTQHNILRTIPQIEKLLQHDSIAPFRDRLGHGLLVSIIRSAVDDFRKNATRNQPADPDELVHAIVAACRRTDREKLRRVINCSGVVIHTNLGRAPLGEHIFQKMAETLSGYCNLEFHLPSAKRGRRGGFAESLLCDLTGAEDALIVNNNASSVFLILNELAAGKEVIVSRGELIQIGGGFRIPDILRQSGAALVEVGTTNITSLEDVRHAVTEHTAILLSVHTSNYRIQGFTESPSLKDLASLKSESVFFVRDLGSGNLVSDEKLPQPFEPTVAFELKQGADLICFSGDKLLGASQAGIIAGRRDLIARLRKNPLMRMLRVDKTAYFILQETLLEYAKGTPGNLPLWKLIFQDKRSLTRKARRLLRRVRHPRAVQCCTIIATHATFGGGSLPAVDIESHGIGVSVTGMKADQVAAFFLNNDIPILGTVADNIFTLDLMTVFDRDIAVIARRITDLLEAAGES